MLSRKTIVGLTSTMMAILCAVHARAQDAGTQAGTDVEVQSGRVSLSSGSGAVTLSPVASDLGTDAQWQVQVQDPSGGGCTVTGTVSIAGVPIGRPDNLGAVSWQLSGTDLSGTVGSSSGGTTLASFKGKVSATGVQGTFTTVDGQRGSWVWAGPAPEQAAATVAGTGQ